MDADTSTLRSGRRWRRRPSPPPPGGEPKPPEISNSDQEAPGSPGPRGAAPLFSCGVCLEAARDPVVTCCGHLFCWPCLYRWVRGRRRPLGACPVCKSTIAVEPGDDSGVTPIYGVEGGLDAVRGGGGGGGGGGERGGGRGDGELSPEVPPRPRGSRGTSEGDDLEEFREGLRDLSRDVDALEERMWRVMALVAQLPPPLLLAYAAEVARRNGTAGSPVVGTRRRRRGGVLGTQSGDGVGDGVYRGTRSRRRQENP